MIDTIWNHYPQKQKYFFLKNILINHLNELKQIRMSHKDIKLLYSYKMQLRYFDEDRNYHLNSKTYYKMIEELLMNYDDNIANGKYLNYSLSLIYWHETPVSKYSHCYMNIYKKRTIHVKNDRTGQLHMAWDIFGVLSVDKCCERNFDTIEGKKHEWIHQTGFVVRIVDKKALKL